MGRKSAIFGVTVLVFGTCALAQSPEMGLRTSEPDQPRYATMIPPSDENMPDDARSQTDRTQTAQAQAAQPQTDQPQAAPTTPVAVAPSETPAPRYASMQPPDESVMVRGLRPSEDTGYRLGTGDKVKVTVFNETDLSGEFEIDSQGYVRLPLIGAVAAAGLTAYGLETRIAATFQDGGYLVHPRVAVEVTTYRPFYIIGEVNKPGEYPYVNAMSVPNAIALAGGYTDRATTSTVYVRHQGEANEEDMPADETTRIRPGDVIRVRRTTYWTIVTLLAPLISPFATAAYLLK
ncbi:MAG: polysaccharide export protein [Alphaproteobacteria bacterium]|nr:polysaccharide export protein [Alphaproteobacteria bacterium]